MIISAASAQVAFHKTNNLSFLTDLAKRENKLIFIDGYTDWCGWCKVLDEKVFGAGAAADTMNTYFVAAKLEMEKDSLGILLARKYAVSGFPTSLILNKDGRLVSIISGYSDRYLDLLMPVIKAGPDQPAVPGYTENIAPDFPAFYINVFAKGKKDFPDSATVNNYLSNRKPDDEVSWNIITRFYYLLNAKQQSGIFENTERLNQYFGNEIVNSVLNNILGSTVYAAVQTNDHAAFSEALKKGRKYLKDPSSFVFYSNLSRLQHDSLWAEMADLILQSVNDTSIGLTPTLLNQYAWDLYLHCNNKGTLQKAISWMQNAVIAKDPQYAHLDTYAALLYKSGKLQAAREAALRAIDAGKKEGINDLSETEKLYKNIEVAISEKQKKK